MIPFGSPRTHRRPVTARDPGEEVHDSFTGDERLWPCAAHPNSCPPPSHRRTSQHGLPRPPARDCCRQGQPKRARGEPEARRTTRPQGAWAERTPARNAAVACLRLGPAGRATAGWRLGMGSQGRRSPPREGGPVSLPATNNPPHAPTAASFSSRRPPPGLWPRARRLDPSLPLAGGGTAGPPGLPGRRRCLPGPEGGGGGPVGAAGTADAPCLPH